MREELLKPEPSASAAVAALLTDDILSTPRQKDADSKTPQGKLDLERLEVRQSPAAPTLPKVDIFDPKPGNPARPETPAPVIPGQPGKAVVPSIIEFRRPAKPQGGTPDSLQPVKPATPEAPQPFKPAPKAEAPKAKGDSFFDPDDRPLEKPAAKAKTLLEARKELFDTARASGVDLTKVEQYSKAFEARATQDFLTPAQIAKSYENISALFAAKTNATFTAEETNRLGLETLFNVAYNKAINQSSHNTCSVTAVEVYAATKRPEDYTALVRQIGLTGEWKSYAGVVHPPKDAIKKGGDERAFNLNSPFEDNRNTASMIVQMTLINGVYGLGKFVRPGPDGKLAPVNRRFLMGPAEDTADENPRTGGRGSYKREDYLVDATGKPILHTAGELAGFKKRAPDFTEWEIQEAAKMLTGEKMPFRRGPFRYSVDVPADRATNIPTAEAIMAQRAKGPISIELTTEQGKVLQKVQDAMMKDGKCFVKVQDEFDKSNTGWVDLEQLRKEGPRRAWRVDLITAEEALKAVADKQVPFGVHTLRGMHVQTIHNAKMHDGQCWVYIDNHHGKDMDGWMKLEDLNSTILYQNFAQPIYDVPGGKLKTVDASYRAPIQPKVFVPPSGGGLPNPYYPKR